MAQVAHDEMVFDDDYTSGRRLSGEIVRFTRRERALLSLFARNQGRLLSRETLHEALDACGSDRNVDYVVNRLRSKLGDTGVERRFIFTQYGEGYIWLPCARPLANDSAMLVIGPVRGLDSALEAQVLAPLHAALQSRVSARSVRLDVTWTRGAPLQAQFSLEVTFHRSHSRVHAAFVLRSAPTGEMIAAFREGVDGGCAAGAMESLSAAVIDAAWKHLALGPRLGVAPSDPPLQLRVMEASTLLDPPGATWVRSREQLARLRAREPDDPGVAIMWAMHLFAESIVRNDPAPLTRQAVSAIEDEIEALTLKCVPAVVDDPVLALAAAKLLLLINRGHADLAEALAQRVFATSGAFAANLLMLGQIHAYRGDLAEADRLYDQSLSFCDSGSEFEIYALMLKAMARLAAEDYDAAAALYQRIVGLRPTARQQFGITFLPPGDEGLGHELAPLADAASLPYAQRVLAYLWFRAANLFRTPAHASAIMRGPLGHLVRRLGPTVASGEIWAEMPQDLHYLRGPERSQLGRIVQAEI
jgi:tetratricopeptide (TPR) repeat protein